MNFFKSRLKESITKAEEVLQKSRVTSSPVPIEEIIEDYGLKLQFIDLKEKSDEISGLYDFNSKTIYVNCQDSPQRQRFTIAHELGHALLHAPELQKNPNLGIFYRRPLGDGAFDSIEEQQANRFAAYLLVPEAFIKEIYPSCKSHTTLSGIFNVSRQVIDYHLKNLGLGE